MEPHPTLAVLPGDGIGPEVIREAVRVLEWAARAHGIAIEFQEYVFGIAAFREHGHLVSKRDFEAVRAADGVLFGAIGGPGYEDVPAEVRRETGILGLRRHLGLFANLRPVTGYAALADVSPLKAAVMAGADLVVVRELTGGLYFGEPRGVEGKPGSRRGVNTHVYTEAEIARIARVAFELAGTRRRRVCSMDKSNVMESSALWRDVVSEIHAAEFPGLELEHLLADNGALQIVRDPKRFDVILTDNMFGDLLSDAAAAIPGSLGMLPSASLGDVAGASCAALYEPVHGSAPDIAGRGIANPLGAILCAAMALRLSLECAAAADQIEAAVESVLGAGLRTADIAPPGLSPVSTRAMADAVLAALEGAR
ncbi:MAG TPA: 3-isopropylmalate dehydrogenase [Alphaproteobacteria bacterium]|nr:3-isopropylmalate dehydrogenase [Alphaproteobacteria bacterium]